MDTVHEKVELVSDYDVTGDLARGRDLRFNVSLDRYTVAFNGSDDVVDLPMVDYTGVGFDDFEVDGDAGETDTVNG